MGTKKLKWKDLIGKTVNTRFLEANGFRRALPHCPTIDLARGTEDWIIPYDWFNRAEQTSEVSFYNPGVRLEYDGGQTAKIHSFFAVRWQFDGRIWKASHIEEDRFKDVPYAKTVVMKYLDSEVDWADHAFRNTNETVSSQ